jgi:thioredoxin-dependent peroxiredoxin
MDYEIRKDGVTLGGNPMDVRGKMLQVGDTAPNFELVATDMSRKSLDDYAGKVKILSIVPSLDTSVCDAQVRHFNEEATALEDDIVVLAVSADLPFAQKRWCGAADVEDVEALSSHMDMQFADDYGTHVLPLRVNQRAVIVLDKDNKVVYTEYVPEIAQQVNFDAALEAARSVTR